MRSFWLSVVVFAGVLLLAGLRVEGGPAKRHPAAAKKEVAAAEQQEPKAKTVNGYGETAQGAQANALREAQEWLERELRGEMKASWPIPREQLDPAYLEKMGVINFKDAEKPALDPEAGPNTMKARYKVTLAPEYVSSVRSEARKAWVAHEKEERQDKAEGRQQVLFRVLAAVAAVLLVAAAYLRLEEATRGYYTGLLRAAALALLALAAIALYVTA